MNKFHTKTNIIYIMLVIYIMISNTDIYINNINTFNYIINPLFWITIFIISIFINKESIKRFKFKNIKLQTIFIIVLTYLIIYFISGLLFGYSKNIYNISLIGIIKNIYVYIIPIIFIEYTRSTLLNTNKNIVNYIIITIIFIFISIDFNYIISKSNYSDIFKDFSSIVIPNIASNILLTYISITCYYYGNLFYRLPQSIAAIILPILPSLNWYYSSILGVFLPLLTYIFIKNINDKIENHNSKRKLKKKSIIRMIYIIIPIFIFICFSAGLFKYKPTAILSNSMQDIYSRGDIVIVEKLNKNELNNLEKYDIIEYILDGTVVTHRIINIETHYDGTKLYITKGDNNKTIDNKKVSSEQITGKVKFSIPKIGYPSVYLNELLNKNRTSKVATGD